MDDIRHRHRTQGNQNNHFTNMPVEHIPLQHGSPDLRRNYVYPSQPSPIPAFQMPGNQSPKLNLLQDLKSISRMSPLTVRSAKVQDSSLSIIPDTDEAVVKISAMFPTVSETHIKLLMKKYHNREALVISALQVEKNPITTPGPFSTPPPQRNIHHPGVHATLHMTPPLGFRSGSRGGSPICRPGSGTNSTYTGSPRIGDTYRNSPRPHSSPKLKLRYMKSIFPQADETVILEILQNNDSNIQKSSDLLKEMGFTKKDTVKVAQAKVEQKKEAERKEDKVQIKLHPPQRTIKTSEEKAKMKSELQEKYKEVANHLITIALESVDFDEHRANQILQIMVQEDTDEANKNNGTTEVGETETIDEVDKIEVLAIPTSQSRHSVKSLMKNEKAVYNNRLVEEENSDYKSPNLINTQGPNRELITGANEKLLLEDYIKWQGANSFIRKGPQSLANGPNTALLSSRSYKACGPNTELRRGPKFGLAKGSIFSQLKTIVVGESRGK